MCARCRAKHIACMSQNGGQIQIYRWMDCASHFSRGKWIQITGDEFIHSRSKSRVFTAFRAARMDITREIHSRQNVAQEGSIGRFEFALVVGKELKLEINPGNECSSGCRVPALVIIEGAKTKQMGGAKEPIMFRTLLIYS
ncbi:hypothetical protein Bbelb_123420 [Branchiostoma belcheri]|nr:hypothetical protein Bbelb_123420 [Branchiostoma belcheri]